MLIGVNLRRLFFSLHGSISVPRWDWFHKRLFPRIDISKANRGNSALA
jgi:hypothetical protein